MATPPVRFHIPEPCSEKWEQMHPTERGAFCAACSKNLYDFTKMTDAQITDVIRNSNEKVCGRFRNDQLVPPQQLPAVTISAMRNAPQVRQFLYVLWMVFGLSLFSCTPETESGITLGAMRTADTVQVDTLGVKPHNVKCAPVEEFFPPITTVGELIPEPPVYVTGIEESTPQPPVIDSVVQIPEQSAQFPGGDKEMMRYLAQQIRYPEMAREANIEGTVFVEFTVHTDGNISNVRLLRGIGYGCDEEAMRAVKTLQGWKPAVMGGRKVPMLMRLPVRFRLN